MLRQEIRRCPVPASVPPRCVHYTCLSLYIICHRGVTRIFQCRFQWRPPFRSNSSLSNKYRGTLCCNLLVSHILPCHIFPFIFIIRLGFNCAILIISSLMGRTQVLDDCTHICTYTMCLTGGQSNRSSFFIFSCMNAAIWANGRAACRDTTGLYMDASQPYGTHTATLLQS
jgi:hypothetical protein